MRSLSKRTAAFVFAGILAIIVILVAATMGIGALSLPDGATAYVDDVDDGEITQEDLDLAIEQAAAGQGGEVPEPGTPQYNAALVPALSDLLLGRWVRGESEERGIAVTEREIDVELETIIEEQFGGQEEFDKFLEQSGFSEEDALDRVELQLLTQCIQDQVIPQDPEAPAPTTEREGCQGEEEVEITEDEIQKFYDDNITQFETPETRDVRTLLNPDEDKAQEAADQLAEDNSAEILEGSDQGAFDRGGDGGARRPATGRPAGAERARARRGHFLGHRGRGSRPDRDRGGLLRPPGREGQRGRDAASRRDHDRPDSPAARDAGAAGKRSPSSRTRSSPSGAPAPSARRTSSRTTRTAPSRLSWPSAARTSSSPTMAAWAMTKATSFSPTPLPVRFRRSPRAARRFVPLRPVIPPIPLPQERRIRCWRRPVAL